jgi:tetratricopeptide (TPR) repeat protein
VESVAWAAERKDLLCALFFLLSILVYAGYAAADAAQRNLSSRFFNKQYLLALVFFTLALLSKPMAVTLPLVLLILDWYPFQRSRSLRTFLLSLAEKFPFIALSLISSILTMFAQKAGNALLSVEDIPLSARALVAAQSLIAYLGKMIFPINLLPFYQYPKNVSFFSLEYLAAIVFVIGITTVCIVVAKKRKLWLSAWSYYLVTLIPVIGIVKVGSQSMADRYAYLPSLGPFLIFGLAAPWIVKRLNTMPKQRLMLKIFAAAFTLFLFVSMTYLTIKQIGIWKNNSVLWTYVIDKEPGIYFAYNNRGITYYVKRQLDEAIEDFGKAIFLYPGYYKSHYNLGLALFEKGLLDQAIEEYQIAVSLAPKYSNAHLNLGVAYARKGLRDRSAGEYQIVENLNPGSAEPFYELGAFFTKRGLLDEAIELLQIAVRVAPDFADAHNNLAAALYRKGRVPDALEHYQVFLRLRPDNAKAHLNLGSAYAASGFLDKAIEQFQIALRLDPGLVDAHYNLGMVYQANGLMDQAVEHLEEAARLNPGDAAVRNDLARAQGLKNSARVPARSSNER